MPIERPVFCRIEPKDTATIPLDREGEYDRAAGELLNVLNGLYPYHSNEGKPQYVKDQDQRAQLALTQLIGTNKTRIGAEPGSEAKADMLKPVQRAVKSAHPLQLVTVWGTSRDPKNPERNYAEMADASTLFMLKSAADRVKAVHVPGALVRVFVEDVACEWLDVENPSNPREVAFVREQMDRYFCTNLKLFHVLSNTLGGLPIELIRESELLPRMGYSREQMLHDCAELKPLFVSYFAQSDEIMEKFLERTPYQSWDEMRDASLENYHRQWAECAALLEKLDSYKILGRNGWIGPITPEMRTFYKTKNAKLNPSIANNPVALNDAVAKYFASTLRKATLATAYFGLPFPDTVIRIPLGPQSNGRPAKFERLVPLRSAPHDTSRRSAPECVAPWLGEGYYNAADGYFHVGQYKEVQPEAVRVPVQVVMNADPVQLGHQQVTYPIPAKIVMSGPRPSRR